MTGVTDQWGEHMEADVIKDTLYKYFLPLTLKPLMVAKDRFSAQCLLCIHLQYELCKTAADLTDLSLGERQKPP